MELNLDNRKTYRVLVDDDGIILAEKCKLASDFLSRFKGLMFREGIADDEALLIVPCNAIHTFFMRFPIDLVFIGQDGTVVKEERNIEPGKVTSPTPQAWAALELKGGLLERVIGLSDSVKGRRIRFQEKQS